ncbi:O-antigen ligase family protein [Chitinophagaceae bacterium LB-8]|uniref:O-antigen ligase family protein n=1 Tax=Paraflavisolibacter caeni TaxID=2982496 RepID=A0A9X2XXZ8_9BACT|nr:O-antigen ligase family protein [Paraflavisolibacter caeni]MCU7550846.1 O-antigen ligase family protein [Paraflavisolibacter caeni]
MERIYYYSILLIAFILPSPYCGLTLALLAIVFVCWLHAGDYKNIPKIIKQPQVFFPFAFYLFLAAGLLYTAHPSKVFSGLSTQIAFALFPLVIGSSSIINKRLIKASGQMFLVSLSFFLFISICYALFDTVRTGERSIMIEESLYSKFRSFGLTSVFRNWHPTYVAMFANLGIAIQLHYCLEAFSKKQIILSTLVVLFLGICLVLLNSLTGIACFVLIGFYYFNKVSSRLHINKRVKSGVLIAAFLGLLSLFFFNPFQNEKIDSLKNKAFIITDNQEQRNLLTMRLAKWETHIDIFKEHWLGGTTFGDINYIRKDTYIAKGYQDLAHYNYNAHNQYLEVLATYGIVGVFIFLGLLLSPIFQSNKYPLFIPFLFIVSITFLTESILVRQQGILFFMFFYALYTHRGFKDTQQDQCSTINQQF